MVELSKLADIRCYCKIRYQPYFGFRFGALIGVSEMFSSCKNSYAEKIHTICYTILALKNILAESNILLFFSKSNILK